jgi:very-short-patch-repair endonuclease
VHADDEIARLCVAHHGIVTRQQAVAAGLSTAQIRYRVAAGRWEQLRPGVYRIVGGPSSPLEPLAAATAAGIGIASHLSAAALLDLVDGHPAVPELTTGLDGSHHHDTVLLHRTGDLLPGDTTTIDGLRTTNAVRTVLDLGARLAVDDLLTVAERALHLRLVHPAPLNARFEAMSTRGRPGAAVTREVLRRLDPSRAPTESELEAMLDRLVIDAGLPTPVRQHVVHLEDRTFRLDLAYPDLRIAIEADGFEVHGSRSAFEADRDRQNLLASAGWLVLRFTWRQIRDAPEDVVATITRAIAQRCAP